MAKLSDVKAKIRKSKKWGFLAEMIGETSLDMPMAGVNHQGVLMVNPQLLLQSIGTGDLVEWVRHEFRVAQELREGVRGFR